jgi:hypothetical protein
MIPLDSFFLAALGVVWWRREGNEREWKRM